MKKLFILLIASISLAIQGYAQSPDILPQVFSPNAAELGKYGKIPVSYFNGLPNISIPLTELKAKDYTLPIYLTYHAGGNKPEQHPGWVGQGWTLHAGGCINRIIRGKKDELTRWEAGPLYDENPGYYYHSDEFQSIHWEDSTARASAVLFGGFDYEPDEFQVNVDGINASFYFVGRERVKVVSKSDVDFTVSCDMNEGACTIGDDRVLEYKFRSRDVRVYDSFFRFIITAKDGTKYYFGGVEDAIEYSITPINLNGKDYWGAESDWNFKGVANTWMLTKIIRPNGEEIVFSYKRSGSPVVKIDSHRVTYSEFNGVPYLFENTFDNEGNVQYYILLPTYLQSVRGKYGNNELKFDTRVSCQLGYDIDRADFCSKLGYTGLFEYLSENNNYEQLESISLNGDRIVHLDYSNNQDVRLRLDSVAVYAPGVDTLKYKMTYYDSTSLPRYNSRKTDIWGYYNREYPYDPCSRDTGESYVPDINRLKAEMLFKIEYPTGGWTEFEYEPHDYSSVIKQVPLSLVRESGWAGGLRVKKIIDGAPDNCSNERTFSYTDELGFSSGILSGRPSFLLIRNIDLSEPPHTFLGRMIHELGWKLLGRPDDIYRYIFFSEKSLIQFLDTDGNHVTYSKVTEVSPGRGKTEYSYSNHNSDGCMDEESFFVYKEKLDDILDNHVSSLSISRGLLLNKRSFNESESLVSDESYHYSQDQMFNEEGFLYSYSYFGNQHRSAFRESLNKIYTFYPALAQKVVKSYPDDGGAPLVETTDYEYDSHRQLVKTIRHRGTHQEETRTLYSGDASLSNRGPYTGMQAAGILGRPVEQTVLHDGKVVSSSLITYRKSGSQYLPDKYYEAQLDGALDTLTPYSGTSVSSVYGNPKMSFDSYDEHGNILQATEEGGAQSRFYWDAAGYHPEASFSGIFVPLLSTVQVEAVDSQSVDFNRRKYNKYTYNFTADRPGIFTFTLAWAGSNAYDVYGTLDGNVIFDSTFPSTSFTRTYRRDVTEGRHSFTIAIRDDGKPGDINIRKRGLVPVLNGEGTISYPVYHSEARSIDSGAWYYSFEKDGNCDTGFKSSKGWCGSKTFNQTIPSGVPYTIDWMELGNNGKWSYRTRSFTGSITIGGNTHAIDNVRIYPSDVSVANWTWTDMDELNSVTDGRGITESYEYDGLKRLTAVIDGDGHKKASYAYHHASVSDSTNYVKTMVYTSEDGLTARETIQYYDGLGRPWQTVRVNAGTTDSGAEMMHLFERTDYDEAGRPFRTWLPFRSSSLLPQTGTPNESLYNDSMTFSTVVYDGSPLERPIREYGPGEHWYNEDKAVGHGYYTNDESSLLSCRKYTTRWSNDTTIVISGGRYNLIPSSTLSVESVTDEDGLTLLTFTDMYGRKVLERRHPQSGENLDTYYLYDDLGRLSAVLPPALSKIPSVSGLDINKYAYLYRYDACGNCIAKKLPGCGWSLMVYDARGTMIMSQDAVQRRRGEWTFSYTDGQGRQCLTGTCTARVDAFGAPYKETTVYARMTGDGGDGHDAYYGYTLYGMTLQSFIVNEAFRWSPFGPTERYDRVLGPVSEGDELMTTYMYDSKGRVSWTEMENHFGSFEREELSYGFTDELLSRYLTSYDGGSQEYTYTYDHWGRPLSTTLSCYGETVLHDNVYDGLGRLSEDRRNGDIQLQTYYLYNVRSWLTGIESGVFDETMSYEAPRRGVAPCWGGNISQLSWRSGTETDARQYSFAYDGYGRLAGATYSGGNMGGNFSTSYSYDVNSNLSMVTYAAPSGMLGNSEPANHIVTYPLVGNQMVARLQSNTLSFIPLMPIGAKGSIYYDSCGRMVRDDDHGISKIVYNELHLPSSLQYVADGSMPGITYGVQYAADGRKLRTGRMVLAEDGMIFEAPTDYVGNLVYKNGVLDKILVDGGFVTAEDGRCHFFVTDHLGNVRVVVNDSGEVEQVNHYYPYGNTADMSEFVEVDEFENGNVHVYEPVLESVDNPFKWGGKEWDADQGAYDFGARMYSPTDARWTTMDPLCEKFYDISPYVYCHGNPVNRVDPSGMHDYYFYPDGTWVTIETGDEYDRLITQSGDIMTLEDKSIMEGMKMHPFKLRVGDDSVYDEELHYTVNDYSSPEMLPMFKFLADHTTVEWFYAVEGDGKQIIATELLSDVFFEKPLMFVINNGNSSKPFKSKIHNHPMGYKNEIDSMSHDITEYKQGVVSRVYFPDTGNIYRISKDKALLEKKWQWK